MTRLLCAAAFALASILGILATTGAAHATGGHATFSKYRTYDPCGCTINTRGGFTYNQTASNYPGTVSWDWTWSYPTGDRPVSASNTNNIIYQAASIACIGRTLSGSCDEAQITMNVELNTGVWVQPVIDIYWDGTSQQVQ